jgi:hypothetical protein
MRCEVRPLRLRKSLGPPRSRPRVEQRKETNAILTSLRDEHVSAMHVNLRDVSLE